MTSKTRIRRVLGAAAVVTAVVAAAPLQAQQGGQQQRPRAERMQQMETMRQQTPEQRLEQRVAYMTEHLALSADQATRVRAILQREHEQRTALFEKAGMGQGQGRMIGARGMRADSARPRQAPTEAERTERQAQMEQRRAQMEQARGEMQQLREQADAQLKQVLSAEQQEKYQSLRPAGPRGEGRPGMMRNGGRPGMKGMPQGRTGGGMGMRGGRGA